MRKTLQKVMSFYLFLFLMPILIIKLPMLAFDATATEQVETSPVAYAAHMSKEIPDDQTKEVTIGNSEKPIQILLYYTHSEEAYHPVVEKSLGIKAVNYHPSKNIMDASALITQHFQLNGATVDVLHYDNMKQLKATGHKMHQAYTAIRPVLVKQLALKDYDVVLDLHRDSLKRNQTTITSNGISYARLSFVVGAENPNYKLNQAFAEAVSAKVNQMMPTISRGVIPKSGDNVDGVYNQDLSSHSLLVELGGIENTEEEINRTIAILTKAITTVFGNTNAT